MVPVLKNVTILVWLISDHLTLQETLNPKID